MHLHALALGIASACAVAQAETGPQASTPTPAPTASPTTPQPAHRSWMSAPPSWLAAVGSPEVSTVRGVLEVENATPNKARFRYTAEVGLDAQRRVVRFVLDGLQSQPATQAANAPYTRVQCRFSKVRNIFDCLSQTPTGAYTLQSTLTLHVPSATAALRQSEERVLQKANIHAELHRSSGVVSMYRWHDDELGEPLSSTLEQETRSRDLNQQRDAIRVKTVVNTRYTSTHDERQRLHLTKIDGTGTMRYEDTRDASGTSKLLMQDALNDRLTITSLHPSGWMTAAHWQDMRSRSTGNPPINIQRNARMDFDNRFEADRWVQSQARSTVSDADESGLAEIGLPLVAPRMQTRYENWGPAPTHVPWRIATETSGLHVSPTAPLHKITGKADLQNGRWVESITTTAEDGTLLQRSVLTLETERPVTVAGGFTVSGFCALADRSCPGYDAPGLLMRLQELNEWMTPAPSPVDLPNFSFSP